MVLTINGTEYRIKFGVGFVRALDEIYFTQSKSGTKFGTGIETKVPSLLTGDILTLAEFLYLGTCAEEKRPTQKEIDDYIDSVDDVDALFTNVLDELKASNATKLKVGEFEKALKALDKEAKKTKEAP